MTGRLASGIVSLRVGLPLVFILGAAVRVVFLRGIDRGVSSDEAVTGLMAFAVLRGEYPVFFFGQGYMGALEAYGTAVVFWLFGASPLLLYAVPLVLSIGVIGLVFHLGRVLFDEVTGLFAALFTAAGPVFCVVFGIAPRLGYVETLALGTILIALAGRVTRDVGRPSRGATILILGFVAGLAVWTNFLVAPYLATAAALILLGRPSLAFFRTAGWGVLGFFSGSLPFWVFNLGHGFWSFALLDAGGGTTLWSRAGILVRESLPHALGMRDLWLGEWFLPAGVLLAAGYLSLGAGALILRPREGGGARLAVGAPLLLLVFALALFVTSRYGGMGSPRYLFPVYTALPLLAAAGVSLVRRRSAWGAVLAVPILLGNLAGVARAYHDVSAGRISAAAFAGNQVGMAGIRPPSGPAPSAESEIPRVEPLVAFLKEKGIRRVIADYGISARLTFESREEIIAAQPLDEKYPPYALAAGGSEPAAIVLRGRFSFMDPETLPPHIEPLGLKLQQDDVGGWRVYWGFELSGAGSSAISPRLWRAESSGGPLGPLGAGGAFDRDVTTRWGSGRPRGEGIWYRLDLGRVETVHRVILLPGVFTTDHPAGLRVEASVDGRVWGVVWERRGLMPGLYVSGGQPRFDSSGVVEARFSPVGARYLKFTHLGEAPPFDWSIGEVFVYAPVSAERGVRREGVVSMAGRLVTLGRTAEARERLSCVLAFDPENADAHRLHSLALKAER